MRTMFDTVADRVFSQTNHRKHQSIPDRVDRSGEVRLDFSEIFLKLLQPHEHRHIFRIQLFDLKSKKDEIFFKKRSINRSPMLYRFCISFKMEIEADRQKISSVSRPWKEIKRSIDQRSRTNWPNFLIKIVVSRMTLGIWCSPSCSIILKQRQIRMTNEKHLKMLCLTITMLMVLGTFSTEWLALKDFGLLQNHRFLLEKELECDPNERNCSTVPMRRCTWLYQQISNFRQRKKKKACRWFELEILWRTWWSNEEKATKIWSITLDEQCTKLLNFFWI